MDKREYPERVWIRKCGDLEEISNPAEMERIGTQNECALYIRADIVEKMVEDAKKNECCAGIEWGDINEQT